MAYPGIGTFGSPLLSYTFITTEPNAVAAPIHNRMPVVLTTPSEWDAWPGQAAQPDELMKMLRPTDDDLLEVFPLTRDLLKIKGPAPPAGDNLLHEIKFDGYRLQAWIVNKKAKLLTRTGLDWTMKYPMIAAALAKLPVQSFYIDGEVCATRPDGTTSFSDLQAATDHKETARLVYFAFDLLFIDGEDLMALPLIEWKRRLQALLRRAPKNIRYVDHVVGNGQTVYNVTCKHDAEGIVSKRIDAPYKPGDRGIWRKTKCLNEDEFVVVGFTNPEGRRLYLGALLLGYYTPSGDLIYAGRAGTGMDEGELKRLYSTLKPLETKKMTVSEPPPRNNRFGSPLKLSAVHWVKPKFVAQVRYLIWTGDGLLRHVVYLGLRDGKPARDVVMERRSV